MPHVTLDGDLTGDYVVDEQLPDGRLILRPDTHPAVMADVSDSTPVTAEEFAKLTRGMLPPDGEG